ncbi:hypothetical protein CPB85DRAFT_1260727 [Mucidula mucida]|nr:hypothetical protein CPB85DRAFT_1260727 [Mucidula mucida]
MAQGQPLVFNWNGMPYKSPPNYRGLFTMSRLQGSRWVGKYWHALSAKEQTYWESVGRLMTAACDAARDKARREELTVVDVDFDIPPYDEDVPLVVPSRPPLPPRPPPPPGVKRAYRRRARAPSAPPQTPSKPRTRLAKSRTEPTLSQRDARVPQSSEPVTTLEAPPLELTFRVQKQPPQPEKDKAWLASQPPPVQDLRLLRRRLRHKRDQEQAKRQAEAEASGVGERALATRERAGASRRGVDE